MPNCALSTNAATVAAVANPAFFSISAKVTFDGARWPMPFCRAPCTYGYTPVMMLEWDGSVSGEQVVQRVNIVPSRANRSIFGVWAVGRPKQPR